MVDVVDEDNLEEDEEEIESEIHRFTIKADDGFEERDVIGFYSLDYTNYGNPKNLDWLVTLRNDDKKYNKNDEIMQEARHLASKYIENFLNSFIANVEEDFVVCVVPREKPDKPHYLRELVHISILKYWDNSFRKKYELEEYDEFGVSYFDIYPASAAFAIVCREDTRATHIPEDSDEEDDFNRYNYFFDVGAIQGKISY